ncbi:MAG TPA: hypothetical protein VI937_03670 [Negativicutes bacterium]|nr:hypothetical protein [Negativicutes bacterium]
MDPLNSQINNPNMGVPDGTKVKPKGTLILRGILYSFLAYLSTFVIASIAGIFAIIFLSYLAFLGGLVTLVLLFVFSQVLPFAVINTLILLIVKNPFVKKGVLLGYLFIILMLLGPFSQYNQVANNANRQKQLDATILNGVASDCKNLPDIYAQDQCISTIAINVRDPSLCGQIKVETISLSPTTRILKDNCYQMVFGVAVEKGDVSYCNNYITDNSSILSYCKLVVTAIANGDYSCSQVKDYLNLLVYCTKGVAKNVSYQKMVSQGVWKTYSWNSYTFSYPPDWQVAEYALPDGVISGLYFRPFSGYSSDSFISINMANCGPDVTGKCVYYHNTMTIYTPSHDEAVLKIFDQFVQKIK